MEISLKLFELEIQFRKNVKNTDLYQPRFIQQGKYVEISFVLYNESSYPINFKKSFNDINELENFIFLLEKIKITAQNEKYQVQLIPVGVPCSNFDIYINGEQIQPESIDYYSQQSIIDNNTKLREKIFFEIENSSRETAYLYHQINNTQKNIDRCKQLIKAIKSNPKQKQLKQIIKKHIPTLDLAYTDIYPNIYQIDLLKIIEIAKIYLGNDDIENKNKLLAEYNKIKEAIEKGYEIKTNYFEIQNYLVPEDTHILLSFFENLESIIKNMKANASTILEYKRNHLLFLQTSINEVTKENQKNSINLIKAINTDENNPPERYKVFLQIPIKCPPYVTYTHGEFNLQINKNSNVFKDIQKQQLEKLTIEERDALIYYKTILYRPINQIIALIRKNNIAFEDALNDIDIFKKILNIIETTYNEYIERKKEIERNPLPFSWRQKSNPKSVERLFSRYQNKTPNLKEYTNIVLLSTPLLESALSKIETTEDIVVYRGTNGMGLIDDQRFVSTSISLPIAKSFATREERNENNQNTLYPNIIQITIPKGSPVLAYTDDLFTDEYDNNSTFNEEQQEILIDPQNFDFNLKYVNANIIANGKMVIRTNYKANPKTLKNKHRKK